MEYSIINMLKRINFLYMQNNFIHIHIEILFINNSFVFNQKLIQKSISFVSVVVVENFLKIYSKTQKNCINIVYNFFIFSFLMNIYFMNIFA